MNITCQESSYEKISYQGAVLPNTSPNNIAVCVFLHNCIFPLVHRFYLYELGCGDGTNLLSLAFYHPNSTFIGIDKSKVALNRAQECAKDLRLKNISFILKDVRDLESSAIKQSDYIIAHGLYSWVPDDARKAILSFCARHLKPDGLAYISYNAQPGWSTRKLVRETFLRSSAVQEAPVEKKAQTAIELAKQLLEDLPSRDYASAVLLADELERVVNGKPWYVFHEYLAEVNDGFWLRDFVKKARSCGLEYVTDAQFCRPEGQIPAKLKKSLANRNLDPVEQEETADLLCHRYFRASILCRSDAVRKKTSGIRLMEEVHIAASLQSESDPFDLTDGVIEHFCSSTGHEITLDRAITKAAVLILSNQWPRGRSLKALYEQAIKFLDTHKCEIPVDSRKKLTDELAVLFESGQITLRFKEPQFCTEISEYPKIHALARYELEHRDALTTPYHLPLAIESESISIIKKLDGSHSLSDLQREFGTKQVEQTLQLLVKWGILNVF